jgi:hypothetical protein
VVAGTRNTYDLLTLDHCLDLGSGHPAALAGDRDRIVTVLV